MLVRILKTTVIDGVEYSSNQVVDLPDAQGKQVVKDGAANAGEAETKAGSVETGEPVKHKPASEKAVDSPKETR